MLAQQMLQLARHLAQHELASATMASATMASAEEVLDEAPLFFIFCTMVTTMKTTTAIAKPTTPARPEHQTWSGYDLSVNMGC